MGESIILRNRQTGEFLARITVLEQRGNKVKLGIEAPGEIGVHRNEMAFAAGKETT